MIRTAALFSLSALALALAASCTDPVHDANVNVLGGEVGGIPQGEYHRAGQPCAVCHGDKGPAKTMFTMAGTVFFGPAKAVGVDQVDVQMVDSLNTTFTAHTNCVGNFYVRPEQWSPAFPVLVKIVKPGFSPRVMSSHVGREPSCANCHKDPPYFDSPGHVRLTEMDTGYTPPACPVSPVVTTPGGQ